MSIVPEYFNSVSKAQSEPIVSEDLVSVSQARYERSRKWLNDPLLNFWFERINEKHAINKSKKSEGACQ